MDFCWRPTFVHWLAHALVNPRYIFFSFLFYRTIQKMVYNSTYLFYSPSFLGFAQSPGDTDLKSEDAYTFLYYLFSLLLVTTSLTFLTTPYVALFQVRPFFLDTIELSRKSKYFFSSRILPLLIMCEQK